MVRQAVPSGLRLVPRADPRSFLSTRRDHRLPRARELDDSRSGLPCSCSPPCLHGGTAHHVPIVQFTPFTTPSRSLLAAIKLLGFASEPLQTDLGGREGYKQASMGRSGPLHTDWSLLFSSRSSQATTSLRSVSPTFIRMVSVLVASVQIAKRAYRSRAATSRAMKRVAARMKGGDRTGQLTLPSDDLSILLRR